MTRSDLAGAYTGGSISVSIEGVAKSWIYIQTGTDTNIGILNKAGGRIGAHVSASV